MKGKGWFALLDADTRVAINEDLPSASGHRPCSAQGRIVVTGRKRLWIEPVDTTEQRRRTVR